MISDELRVKVYVDNNIVSGLANHDFPDTIVNNFFKVLALRKEGKVEFWTSQLTQMEIERIDPQKRYYHEIIYNLLDNISLETKSFSEMMMGIGLYREIEKIIPEKSNPTKAQARKMDIEHLYQFKKNALDIFWTEDQHTILNYSGQLKELGILVKNTQDLIKYIDDIFR